MPLTDPLGDMLTRIRNGQQARKDSVTTPASKLRVRVLDVLQREGYIRGYREEALGQHPGLRIELKYFEGQPAIQHVARVSKPGRRVYSGSQELPRNANPTRVRNRCELTGRSRAYYRKFRLSRVMLRELANKGLIPGVTKSSW
jgi:small subunit ribosomal protein S8